MARASHTLAALVLSSSLLIPVAAQPRDGAGKGTIGNPNAEQALPALKALELNKLATLQTLNRRIEQCVRQASSLNALHQCRRQARQSQRELHTRMRQQLQAISQRYGLPMPKSRTQDEAPKGEPEER
jgi:TolA-binding protein